MNIPAIEGFTDTARARMVFYQSGVMVHAPFGVISTDYVQKASPAQFGGDIVSMFTNATVKFFYIPAGTYPVATPVVVPDGSFIFCEDGAVFQPTAAPALASTHMFDLGTGVTVNRFHVLEPTGVHIARVIVVRGNSQIGWIKSQSVDSGWSDGALYTGDDAGAILLQGNNHRIGRVEVHNHFNAWTADHLASNIIVDYQYVTGCHRGFYAWRGDNVHVMAGRVEHVVRPVRDTGDNSILYAGMTNSSFHNQVSIDAGEHAWRLGVGNAAQACNNIKASNLHAIRPLGCAFKSHPSDSIINRNIQVANLTAEDVGAGNPAAGDPGNTAFIRLVSTIGVNITGAYCRANAAAYAAAGGLFIQGCDAVQIDDCLIESTNAYGALVQTVIPATAGGGTRSITHMSIKGMISDTGLDINTEGLSKHGFELGVNGNTDIVRRLHLDLNIFGARGDGIVLGTRPNGTTSIVSTSTFTLRGSVANSTGASKNIHAIYNATGRFIDSMFAVPDETFVPSVAFSTPGTSSFTYATRTGTFRRDGQVCHFAINLDFTPTIGTGTGAVRITGLPFAAKQLAEFTIGALNGNWVWPTNGTQISARSGAASNLMGLVCQRTTGGQTSLATTNLTDGVSHTITVAGSYIIG